MDGAVGMIHIETERLIVREHKAEDLEEYHLCVSDPAVMRYIIGFKQTMSVEESQAKLTEAIESAFEVPRVKYFLAITLKDSARYIGSTGGTVVRQEKNSGIMAIGYFLNKRFWNQGYATEATRALIGYVFENTGYHKIFACCNAANGASARVMQKCGLEKESLLRLHRYEEGSWQDELQYAAIKGEWGQ